MLRAATVLIVIAPIAALSGFGTIAGVLLTDLILGRENPWATVYDPSRKTWRALGRFAGENLNVARQYGDPKQENR